MTDEKATEIARLNDALRTTFQGGSVNMTSGISALADPTKNSILRAVQNFTGFSEDNDPYGEHDCASVDVGGIRIIWKIDYYDLTLTYHSDNPADASVTRRVLTIMLAEEY